MTPELILVVEDDASILFGLTDNLRRAGYRVHSAGDGRQGLELARTLRPDLILLDLLLPGLSGHEICRRLRADGLEMPVVMLTALGEEAQVVRGLNLGADDYVIKPFSPRVLMARIRAVLRRHAELQQIPVDNRLERLEGRLVIDPDRHVITVDGTLVDLTVTEFGILNHLAQRPGFVRTRDQIIAAVHGRNVVLSSRTVDVHMTALRRKLGDMGAMIETVRGVGYRLAEGEIASAE